MNNLTRRNQQGRGMDPWKDFFDADFLNTGLPAGRNSMPAVNLSESDSSYTIDLAAPGYKKDDFHLKVNDDVLTISAESKNERSEGSDGREYSRREYTCSSFTRSFRLPENVKDDAISAKYDNGMLQINIPKSEKEEKASKEIKVS